MSQPTVSIPGGLDEQIAVLEELVTLPMRHPELESKYGIKPARGVLLYGPPGTGKTLLARYIAAKTGAHLTVINGPDIVSKFFGETESKVRSLCRQRVNGETEWLILRCFAVEGDICRGQE